MVLDMLNNGSVITNIEQSHCSVNESKDKAVIVQIINMRYALNSAELHQTRYQGCCSLFTPVPFYLSFHYFCTSVSDYPVPNPAQYHWSRSDTHIYCMSTRLFQTFQNLLTWTELTWITLTAFYYQPPLFYWKISILKWYSLMNIFWYNNYDNNNNTTITKMIIVIITIAITYFTVLLNIKSIKKQH